MRISQHFSQLWEKRSPTASHIGTYIFFALLRLVLVFVPQLGYVHPDEFFQSVEVMTGKWRNVWKIKPVSLHQINSHRGSLSLGAHSLLGVQ